MLIKSLQDKKLAVIERLNQVIKDLSKTTFEVDGNEIIDVELDYDHTFHTVGKFNNKICNTNVQLTIQYEEDLK